MQTQVTARHFDAPSALQEYAEKQLAKLERYYDGITDAHVVLRKGSGAGADKEADVTLNVYQQRLNAKDTAATHEEAIDHCVKRLRRQLKKYKAKLRSTDKDSHR